MGKDGKTLLRTTLSDEVFEELKTYAKEEYAGNISEATRALVGAGLEQRKTSEGTEAGMEPISEDWAAELEERLAKTASRGTKASLASLSLNSYMLASICEILKVISKDNALIMRALGLKVSEDSEIAFSRIEPFLNRHPSQIFNWAWDTGGRLQAQKGQPDIAEAAKGVKFRLSGEER